VFLVARGRCGSWLHSSWHSVCELQAPAFQGGERGLCPSRGSLRLIKAKGVSAPFGDFPGVVPSPLGRVLMEGLRVPVNMSLMSDVM